ncbi:GntR family transcriptional regulator / MocR family aminotransferase [Tenacibaculum sp. 190524A05c]|uniref:MocR-like pyridoxine biosynthesis transcription factor PdxR n=1 Tax=Tenacibaculum platacis TaxID=3137852 RepID=UPI0031FAFD95
MFPFKTSLFLDRSCAQPLYVQLSNQIIQLIKDQKLPSKTKLPGTRALSEDLGVHRKTVVACYEELLLQGWVESIPKKGTFVNSSLPDFVPLDFVKEDRSFKNEAGFSFYSNEFLNRKINEQNENVMYVNDGISDTRLTPVNEIARTYRRIANRTSIFQHLSYGSTFGNEKLREVLAEYLNTTRGLHITKENILITRGSQNGIYLSSQLLLKKGDVIVVGKTNYISADLTFLHANAVIERVAVDECGLVMEELERLCKKKSIKAVYVTSHHHHPSTVTMSAERRIHLLNLAKKYGFAILEDDYDYDFNYNHAPILPLASHDTNGNVVYIGSVCKTVAPVFRVGYLIANPEFINEAANLRRIVDRQGDALLELTFADFIQSGELDSHIRKVIKVYKARRDLFCELLSNELSNFFEFEIPKGGMAVWLHLREPYQWEAVAKTGRKHKLEIGDYERYDSANTNHNCIRVGFASFNEIEIKEFIVRLKLTMRNLEKDV